MNYSLDVLAALWPYSQVVMGSGSKIRVSVGFRYIHQKCLRVFGETQMHHYEWVQVAKGIFQPGSDTNFLSLGWVSGFWVPIRTHHYYSQDSVLYFWRKLSTSLPLDGMKSSPKNCNQSQQFPPLLKGG